MPDHEIKMTMPWTVLGGRDIRFDVHIDGRKRGELLISEGGLTWWPRAAKSIYHERTWEQLAAFMEA